MRTARDRHEQTIRLRPGHSKNKHGRVLPVVGALAAVIDRRLAARRLDCPYIFRRDGEAIGEFPEAVAASVHRDRAHWPPSARPPAQRR